MLSIYETTDGRFVLAREVDGGFTAPLSRDGATATGCHSYGARTIDAVAESPNVTKYASLAEARAALRLARGEDETDAPR